MTLVQKEIITIKNRRDFLLAAKDRRSGQPGFLLQARNRLDKGRAIRVGYTCSKKIGNSVLRNRAKRRLRELARIELTTNGNPGWDYVLVGRPEATIARKFSLLVEDFSRAIKKVHL